MELSKSLKKILLISASALMVASVSGVSVQSLAPNINAQAKTTKVHHHRHHRYNHKRNKQREEYILDEHKYNGHKHHKTHRHHRSHKHSRKHSRKYYEHTNDYYDHLGKHLRHKILKYHKKYIHGDTYNVIGDSYYAEGFRDASHEKAINPLKSLDATLNRTPGIIVRDSVHDHGSKNNYALGWIDGYVNGNYNDNMRPSRDTKFRLYNDAYNTYMKLSDYVAQPVHLRDNIVYVGQVE